MVAYMFMDFKPYKNVIFDFDQTLATIIMDWSSWYPGVMSIIKRFEPNFDENTDFHMYAIHQFINKYGKAFRDDYIQFELKMEKENYQGYQLIETTFNLLQTFYQQGKNLYLLTSNSREVVSPILKELQIADHFDKIITLDDVENVKPSPAPFKLIASDKIDKSQYLMIGDSISDREFAQNVEIGYLDVKDL